MDIELVVNHRNIDDVRAFHPERLSTSFIVEAESRVVFPYLNRLDSSLDIFFIWIGLLGTISWIWFESVRFKTVKIKDSIFPCSQTPCRSCKFYAENLYIRCAVHPKQVLTKEAGNCVDYCNKKHSNARNKI